MRETMEHITATVAHPSWLNSQFEIRGRAVMSDIFDGYERLARMIEARPLTPDVASASEDATLTLYRTRAKLLDNVDKGLAALEIKARHAAEKTDDALRTVDKIYGHIMAARGEVIAHLGHLPRITSIAVSNSMDNRRPD